MSKITVSTLLVFLFCFMGCKKPLATISVSETNGLNREMEYISTEIPLTESIKGLEFFFADDTETGVSVPVQILDTLTEVNAKALRIIFPVDIQAHGSKIYHINIGKKTSGPQLKAIELSEDKFSVENVFYKAVFSTEDDPRGGQINGIFLKDFGDQLLKRGHIAMHWAPNFSKGDSESYFNFENLPSTSQNNIDVGRYQIVKSRSGATDSVPEIDLDGKYIFYGSLPYFLFESTMTMNQEVELDLLRNDEMTMDSLFTHVVYRANDGKISHLKLYDAELDALEDNHIPDDSDFVAFYNLDKGYGFGSIRLKYDNTGIDGNPSSTHRPYTKISKASQNGRYWNRVLSDTIQHYSKGNRYYEKNAYLIFKVDKDRPEMEILYYQERLNNRLTVTVDISN